MTEFLLEPEQLAKIDGRERAYKVPGAEKIREHLQAFLDGDDAEVDVNFGKALDMVDWRITDTLNQLAAEHPEAFRNALAAIWQPPLKAEQADAFWAALDPALDALPAATTKKFNGVGTRASVASFFLFVADPAAFPFYRPGFGGKAINFLYDKGEHLSQKSPGNLLTDYTSRCQFLRREFKDAGVPLQDMLDLQSALYIAVQDYIKPLEGK